jgi:hypothetical protein
MHPEALSYLRDAVGAVKANAKPRPKLPRMADHRALIELDEALIAHGAANPDRDHMLSAVAIRDGCMILFAVACPLRRSNFEALELGVSLLRDELGYRVAFEASAMKNHRPNGRRHMRRLAKARRLTRNHRVHRNAGLGSRRSDAVTIGISAKAGAKSARQCLELFYVFASAVLTIPTDVPTIDLRTLLRIVPD